MSTYEFEPSPNNSSREGHSIDGVILHFTAGGNMDGTVKWFQMKDSSASSHYLVSRSGKIIQMVKEDRAAWHAGSKTTKPILNGRTKKNLWTIGIEICNWGWLYECLSHSIIDDDNTKCRKTGTIYTRFKKWTYPYYGQIPYRHMIKSKVLTADKSWPGGDAYLWEPYSNEAINAVEMLLRDILSRHPHITREWFSRHQDVDPTRKLDPGPAFPFNTILDRIFKKEITKEDFQIGRRKEETATKKEMEDMYESRKEEKKSFCW